MIADEIRELQHASPFEPYTIHTSDGKALYVHHPDYLFITPGNHTVYVFAKTDGAGDRGDPEHHTGGAGREDDALEVEDYLAPVPAGCLRLA